MNCNRKLLLRQMAIELHRATAFPRTGEQRIMEEPKHAIPHRLVTFQVLLRFAFRLALLSVCAAYSRQGFAPAFPVLLALSALFCAFVGIIRREAIFGSALTHWDEATAYALISRLAYALS
jgi:hypothetical protein